MQALFQRNSGHPAVLTSGETGEITVDFLKKFSEIPARFQWNSIRISKGIHHKIYSNTAQISLENSDKFPGGIQLEFRWHSGGAPGLLQRNSTGTPAEYHSNSAGLTSEETCKIPADFQQKLTGNLPEYSCISTEKFGQISLRNPSGTSGITAEFRTSCLKYQPESQQNSRENSAGIPVLFFSWVKNLEAEIHCHAPSK